MPRVSVLMPVYNVSVYPDGWVNRALRSVIVDQSIDVELCMVDDCSTDDTQKYIKGIGKPVWLKSGQTEKNTGGEGAVNLAAEMATGDYFILLSCRSWYEPESLTKMANYLDTHPEVGFVYGRTHFHNDRRANGGEWLKTPNEFDPQDFKRFFASSFGYMYRREAWDAGMRYGCTIYIPEEDRYMTIADYHMVMNLIFKMNWKGYAMRDTTALHYHFGGEQMNNLLVKYKARINEEFARLWAKE